MAPELERARGPAAVLGGVLWAVGVVVAALKPEGRVATECGSRADRPPTVR